MKGIKLRKYRGYRFTKRSGKFIRDNFAPNPTESLGVFGIIGKAIGFIINYLIAKPVYWLTFGLVGKLYNKEKHPAWLGSVMYTALFIGIMGLLGAGISLFTR